MSFPFPGISSSAPSPSAKATTGTAILQSDEVRLLTEVGFVAAGIGALAHAESIFGALKLIRPHRAFPFVGQAVALLNRGQAEAAVTLLESARGENQDEQAMLDAWRGFALAQAGRAAQSEALLDAVAQGEGDGPMLARRLLNKPDSTSLTGRAGA